MTTEDAARADALARLQELTGSLQRSRIAPAIDVIAREDLGAVEAVTIRYAVESGVEVPAYLLLPRGIAEARPCVALHQTTIPASLGKREPAGVGGLPNMAYGVEMARRGAVVVCPDYPKFGEYDADLEEIYGWKSYGSVSMKGIANHIAAIDLLGAVFGRPLDSVIAIGHSLGGTNAILLGCFDPRVGCVVSSCGFSSFSSYAAASQSKDLTGWARREKYMPLIREKFDLDPENLPIEFGEILGLVAPRALFLNIARRDDVFDFDGATQELERARPIFEARGAAGNLATATPDAGHDFPTAAREAAYAFAERHCPPLAYSGPQLETLR